MFVDIRDFTPFAEANTAEDMVARLNALFEIVVPAVVDAGGHVNKFLGDGALAVFGASEQSSRSCRCGARRGRVDSASGRGAIRRRVPYRYRDQYGTVIAGTIGGGSKLEFTLIGDTVTSLPASSSSPRPPATRFC